MLRANNLIGFGLGKNRNLLLDLKAFWAMEESSGTRYDLTGRGNNLTQNGASIGRIAGKVSYAALFDTTPTAQYFSIATNADVSPGLGKSFTLMALVYPTAASGNIALFDKWGNTGNAEYHLFYNHVGYAQKFTFLASTDGTNAGSFLASATCAVNNWYLVVAVYDYAAGLKKLSINGGAFLTGAQADGAKSGPSPLLVGSGWNVVAPFFKGYFDQAAIWHRALSQDEVTQIYNNGKGLHLL